MTIRRINDVLAGEGVERETAHTITLPEDITDDDLIVYTLDSGVETVELLNDGRIKYLWLASANVAEEEDESEPTST